MPFSRLLASSLLAVSSLTLATTAISAQNTAAPQPVQRFSCGPADTDGVISIEHDTHYSSQQAGFDLGTTATIAPITRGSSGCSAGAPFFLSFPLPEGSYRVTVSLGGELASVTTVRAEARRLVLEKVATGPGKSVTRTFDVNLRTPEIYTDTPAQTSGKQVKLKPREVGNLDWDRKLTLEFNGDHPGVRSITIAPVPPGTPTVFLAGDSTVVDQDIEPWAAWGQMLPRFFRPGVVIANHAESGETIRSFVSEQRFAKIFSLLKPGDYLFFQFNHNDQKVDPHSDPPGQAVVPLPLYRQLLTQYIALARAAGATPVLVTSMHRRTFDAAGQITNSLGEYPDAMRAVARDQHVALVDLNAMSKTLFEALGPDASQHAFMHYAANTYPNQTEAISDDTHFNSYGAYELARSVVHGIRADHLPLARFLDPAVPDFDPAHPDPLGTFALPFTPIPPKDTDVDTTKVPQT